MASIIESLGMGTKKLNAEEEATMKWILDLPFTPIPGGALSYEKDIKDLNFKESINKIINEDK